MTAQIIPFPAPRALATDPLPPRWFALGLLGAAALWVSGAAVLLRTMDVAAVVVR